METVGLNPIYLDNALKKYPSCMSKEKLTKYREVHRVLEVVVRRIHAQVLLEDGCGRLVGQIKEVGSAAEGSYTTGSDFDFLLVLENLLNSAGDIRREIPRTTKSRILTEDGKVKSPKSYFQVSSRNDPTDEWFMFMCCEDCMKTSAPCDHNNRFVHAGRVQEHFEKLVADACKNCALPAGFSITRTERHGPAVSVFFSYEGFDSKVDITIAFEVSKSSDCWPFNGDLKLREAIGDKVDVCHLVPAGDYWKLSFPTVDQSLLSPEDKKTLVTLKLMRDQEHANLPSYLLKTELMKSSCPTNGQTGSEFIESTVVRMVQESTISGQKDAYIEDELIAPRDHSSYPEPYRILDHLKKLRGTCYKEGIIHTVLWSLILFVLSFLFFGVSYMASISNPAQCQIFSDWFSINTRLSTDCMRITQTVEESHFYDSENYDSMSNILRLSVGMNMFTRGLPWQIQEHTGIGDNTTSELTNATSELVDFCQRNLALLDWYNKCLVTRSHCYTQQNIQTCQKAFLMLSLICTYIITCVCIIGLYRTHSRRDIQQKALYTAYRGLQVMYIVVFSVMHVFMSLALIICLQNVDWVVIILSVCSVALPVYILVSLIFLLLICNSHVKLATAFHFVLFCISLWGYVRLIVASDVGYHISKVSYVDVGFLLAAFSLLPSMIPLFLYVSDPDDMPFSVIIKTLIILFAAILLTPVAVTILVLSGVMLLLAVIHIFLSCTRGGEFPRKYRYKTIQNQSYWCFQPVFTKLRSLYCTVPIWQYILATDMIIDNCVSITFLVVGCLFGITLCLFFLCIQVYGVYIFSVALFPLLSELFVDMISSINSRCKQDYIGCLLFTYILFIYWLFFLLLSIGFLIMISPVSVLTGILLWINI